MSEFKVGDCVVAYPERYKPQTMQITEIKDGDWLATLNALKTFLAKRGKEGEKVLVRVLNIMQGQRYIEICERNPKQEQFFYGWINNRIA